VGVATIAKARKSHVQDLARSISLSLSPLLRFNTPNPNADRTAFTLLTAFLMNERGAAEGTLQNVRPNISAFLLESRDDLGSCCRPVLS